MTLPVYYYHRVGAFRPGAPPKMNVDPVAFREHVDVIARRAQAVSLDALVAGPAPRGAVAVTFDDGYKDLLEHALPLLVERKIPATFFIVAGAVGGTDSWNEVPGVPNEPLLSWDDLKRLRDAGMTIGSHSATHPRMDEIDAARQLEEARSSRERLESELGVPVRHFAYPQGRYSPSAEAAVKQAGYAAGWATRKGRALGDGEPTALKRVPVSGRIRGPRFAWELLLMRWGLR